MNVRIPDGAVILFQGDSITDAGRTQGGGEMGSGYPALISAWTAALNPERKVYFLNRGISGNRSGDLLARWQNDCLDLRPNVISILAGVNDSWHRFKHGIETSASQFEKNYRALLEQASRALTVQIVLLEPFVLPVVADYSRFREDLDPKIHIVRKLAVEYNASLIPLDGIFARASCRRPAEFWAADGVHPTPAGHALIAQAWIQTVWNE